MRNPPRSELRRGWERELRTWPHYEASSFVEAAGIRWHVQRMGQGRSLLLLHGTGASTHSWRAVMPQLARHYSVLAVDLPGHAFTEPLDGERTSIEGIAEALSALLRALEFDPEYCVGHSAGAAILCKMALQKRIRPKHIVSSNGAFIPFGGTASLLFAPLARCLANSPGVARMLAPGAHRARQVTSRLIARTGSTLDEEGIELYTRLVRRAEHVAGAMRMMANWQLHGLPQSLATLEIPMTLIVGEHDLMVPPQQASVVQQMLKQGQVRRLDGLGHLAHEERPALFAQEVLSLCDPM